MSLSTFNSAHKGEVTLELVHHNGGAGALPLFADGTVALVRQWRYVINRYSLEIAAGRIEKGQTPEEAARRELEEEIGVRAKNLKLISDFLVAPGYCDERIYTYLATDLQPSTQNLDDDEEIEIVKMPLAEALAKAQTGEIDDAKSMITLLTVARMKL
ncbi:MAG: NUDIX hydrolase [Acidobacteriota bacterium]